MRFATTASATPPRSQAGQRWAEHLATSRHITRTHASPPARAPCVLITAPDGQDNASLQLLAAEVRQQLPGLEALVVAPSSSGNASPAAAAGKLTLQRQLELQQCPGSELTFSLAGGATATDCVLAAVDQGCGLMQHLHLAPVLVLVGIARGPALSSDMDTNPAVAVARQAALLGLPVVAASLATTSERAPLQPAVAATVGLVAAVLRALQHTSSSNGSRSSSGWRPARNFPRAHFPFPEEGRWALGTQLPLPAGQHSGGSSDGWLAAQDCWALGDDNSWLGEYTGSSSSSRGSRDRGRSNASKQEACYRVIRAAFADGDLLLSLNVPPTWTQAAGYAATRPGVLWHCWQVEAQGQQHGSSERQAASVGASSSDSSSDSSSGRWSHLYSENRSSSSDSRSWHVDSSDLFGRTLPSSGYGSQAPTGANFVAQDNTRKVASEAAAAAVNGSGGGAARLRGTPQRLLPRSFVLQQGTLLNDAAACGDVEAVFGGKAAVTVVQTWPAGHPLSCRDEILLAALDAAASGGGDAGLPAWLQV